MLRKATKPKGVIKCYLTQKLLIKMQVAFGYKLALSTDQILEQRQAGVTSQQHRLFWRCQYGQRSIY